LQLLDPTRLAGPATLLSRIGNTPLLRLDSLTSDLAGIQILGKAEYLNPGGSVKDRPAFNMIQKGIEEGRLRPGKTILDSTSGNTGIAYAMIGAALGYPVKLCLPANASAVCRRMIKAHGAELVLTDPAESSDGAILACRKIHEADPDHFFYPDQYNNPANWQAHFETTGPEIIEQTGGSITQFVAGLGTSGTFTGVTKRLRKELPDVACVSVQPSSGFHGLEGLKHMPSAIVPGFYDEELADENMWVDTEDAYTMLKTVAREEGLLLGFSSGANLFAARKIAEQLHEEGREGTIVTILADGAAKYLEAPIWD
jgi:cysteine synthase B